MKVYMFHSLGLEKSTWADSYLSVPWEHMGKLFEYFSDKKYATGFLDEWYEKAGSSVHEQKKEIVLTFDDGYLDNWVFLFPLLKKYNIKATIFVNPEFVDPGTKARRNLDDVWENRTDLAELESMGFLNWKELEIMDASDFVDIQSHTMSHNWYFKSTEIKDFYDPGLNKFQWMAWINKPDRKPFYMNEDASEYIISGSPVFDHGRALSLRRYSPPPGLNEYISDVIRNSEELNFPLNHEQKEYLKGKSYEFMVHKKNYGRIETDEEMYDRYKYEIYKSKEILESKLKKKVEYLCWPGGGYNDLSLHIAERSGYKASTIASRDQSGLFLNSGEYKRIRRTAIDSSIILPGDNRIIDENKFTLVNRFRENQGEKTVRTLRKIKKLFFLMQARLKD